MCVLLPIANQSAFSVAAFSGLSDIHKCSGGLQLVLVAIGEKQPGCNSPRNCLIMLCIDWLLLWYFELCGTLSGVIWKCKFTTCCLAHHFMTPHHSQPTTPYRSIVVLVKNYLKQQAIQQLSIEEYMNRITLCITTDLWRIVCKQLYTILRYYELNISKWYF